MIFYFSGTGNSHYVAKQLAEKSGEELVNMAEFMDQPQTFQLSNHEPVGFVFPVYFYTVNDIVFNYIKNLTLTGNGYTYAIVTCGASIGGTGGLLKSELKKQNIHLDNVYPLVMPDNAVFYYNIVNQEQAKDKLKKAEEALETIRRKIEQKEVQDLSSGHLAKLMRPIYHAMSGTKRFSVTEQCISCGKCEKNCPVNAIEMIQGHPIWTKKHCVLCSSCINRCPVQAIQYGKRSGKRNRYENPYVSEQSVLHTLPR